MALTAVVVMVAFVGLSCRSGSEEAPLPSTLEATPDPTPTGTPLAPLGSTQAQQDAMYGLLQSVSLSNRGQADSAISDILAMEDRAFVPVLIEVLRLPVNRPSFDFNVEVVLPALQLLTGENFSYDLKAWDEWLGRQQGITAPEGYVQWKAALYSRIDPRFADFFVDPETNEPFPEEKIRLDLTQVVWGGVFLDDGTGFRSIPALVNPLMITPDEADYLNDSDRVFGVSINGDHRAYPLRVMNPHEMANDVVGGVPVALAYCTLCGAGILYDTTVGDTVFTFRTSGLLFKSNKLMYDLATKTIWNQFTGEPVLGELADSGIRLEILPIAVTTWGEWLARHPDTQALSTNTGYNRSYASEDDPNAVYFDYFASPDTMFAVPEQDDRLELKDAVFGLEVEGAAKAYPIEAMRNEPVANDTLGGVNVVLITEPASGAVRAYERGDRIFQLDPESQRTDLVLDQEGEVWRIEESVLVSVVQPEARLERIGGHAAYWFAWYSFFPETTVYEAGE
ncbi:MAG: DUF3179 domain-containing protein [Dehalococcoidia bacterium]